MERTEKSGWNSIGQCVCVCVCVCVCACVRACVWVGRWVGGGGGGGGLFDISKYKQVIVLLNYRHGYKHALPQTTQLELIDSFQNVCDCETVLA